MKLELHEEYAWVCAQLKAMEELKAQLAEKVIADLKESNVETYTFGAGTMTIGERKTWKYPDDIEKREREIKALKANAQETGEAEAVVKEYLTFRPVKEEEK